MTPVSKRYDIFTFLNELDLLEIRLNILYDHVDYFVIIECAETFSGHPKPLYFAANKARFQKFADKIIYYEVKNVPVSETELRNRLNDPVLDDLEREIITNALTSDNVPTGQLHWLKEFYQKESIKKALVNLANDDTCFIGDVDEIWNPATVIDFTKDDIYKLRQNVHTYYLNNRSSEPWAGTLVTKYKNIKKNCLNHLRTVTKTQYTYVDNGGWHFTNQGGVEQIKKKLESYGHQEFNNPAIKSQLEKKLKKNQDFIGRNFTFWVDESDLPAYIIDHKTEYQHLFKKVTASQPVPVQLVIVKLTGGLGNQLFQYATARALAIRRQAQLLLDTSGYEHIPPGNTPRHYSLNYFNISADFATTKQVYQLKVDDRSDLFSRLRRRLHPNKPTHVIETANQYNPTITVLQPPVYLDGYWQSEKYFQDVAAQLRQEIILKPEYNHLPTALVTSIQQTKAVSIHVRRGDYVSNAVTNQFHSTSPISYYQAAVEYVTAHLTQPHCYVFSDDIEWVKQNLLLPPTTTTFVSNGHLHDYEELMLMSQCQHHIIANSSFSWWGAWLNPSLEKLVIAPKQWFNTATINPTDLLPKDWIKL